jgi:hypothetical protein
MKKTLIIDKRQYDILKKTMKSLGDFSHFDNLEVYEDGNSLEVYTISKLHCYSTKTIIDKSRWRLKAKSYWKKTNEAPGTERLILKTTKK